jgi:hypothetical protein
METQQLSTNWEKVKVLSALLASVLIPVVLAIIGQAYTSAIKDREIGAKYVELAVGILRSPPAKETRSLRDWAIETINHCSAIPLNQEARDELRLQSLAAEMQALLEERRKTFDTLSAQLKAKHDSSMVRIPNLR